MLSCYIIAHQDKWKSIYTEKRSEESAVEGESIKEGLGYIEITYGDVGDCGEKKLVLITCYNFGQYLLSLVIF